MRERIERRNLGARVDRLQVLRESADDHEALAPPHRRRIARLCRPRDGSCRRHVRAATLVEKRDELRQQLALALELEAERATSLQIVRKGAAECHATPPGQGWARLRR